MVFLQAIEILCSTFVTIFKTLFSVYSIFEQISGIRANAIAIAISISPFVLIAICYILKGINLLWRHL